MASEQIETVGQCAWCLQRDRQAFALVCPEHVNQWRVLLDDLQRDIQALCRAVGEFDGARPETPQVVLQICTDKAARLRALVSEQAREIERLREALLENAESTGADGKPCWCGYDTVYYQHANWCKQARAALAARGGKGGGR